MDNKQKIKWGLQLPFLLFLLLGTIFIIRHQRNTPYQHNTGYIFGTVYHITYQYDTDLNAEILAELNKVDASLSMFNKQSVITRVNNNQNIEVNDMFTDVFTLAEKISNDTNGAFDITVAPLVNAWGFGFKNGQLPTRVMVDSLKSFVGYKRVTLIDKHVKKDDPRTTLDCGAIAKGYGCDMVAELLRRKGVANFMVEIGGEVVTCGISDRRLPWKIGVTKPSDDSLNQNQELQAVLNVTDKAMATSGNYRNFYYKDGKKYAHTIDPHTGFPVQHSLLSATVLADRCAVADAYATSFMVMGIEKAKEVLKRNPKLMAYFIYADEKGNYKVWYSPSMKGKIVGEK
ncbi:MAG: FAD:protein FMN transferase [Prevotella sp.]|nr:FAD:protein FMN transferase [Prevotella sp.]MEE0336392.1 FAD:protein FMN transferase [Prevotella sp.]